MKGAALRAFVKNEIVEIVINDLTIVESDFCKLLAGDLDNFVHMSGLAGVVVVDAGITRITRLWVWYCLDAAQCGLMSMCGQRDPMAKR